MVYKYNPVTDELQISPITKSTKCTPLMHAILKDHEQLVYDIIKNDPNTINQRNYEGWTALHIVARNSRGWKLEKYLLLLLQNGANPNILNNVGWTALISAARCSNTESSEDTVKILLQNGANPNIQNNDGKTALHFAAKCSDEKSTIQTVKILLEYGADPNIKDINGRDVVNEINVYACSLEIKYEKIVKENRLLKLAPMPGEDFIKAYFEEYKCDDPVEAVKKFVDVYSPILQKNLEKRIDDFISK